MPSSSKEKDQEGGRSCSRSTRSDTNRTNVAAEAETDSSVSSDDYCEPTNVESEHLPQSSIRRDESQQQPFVPSTTPSSGQEEHHRSDRQLTRFLPVPRASSNQYLLAVPDPRQFLLCSRNQRSFVRANSFQSSGFLGVAGSPANRNQVIYVGSYTTTTLTNQVVILGGSEQRTMERSNYNYFGTGPSSQGYDTTNGYPNPNGQLNAAPGTHQHAMQNQYQQHSQTQYNGQMPMGGGLAPMGPIIMHQNHAVNNNYFFANPGQYNVQTGAGAIGMAEFNSAGPQNGPSSQGGAGAFQMPTSSQENYGYQPTNPAWNAAGRQSASPLAPNPSFDATPPPVNRPWPHFVSSSANTTPTRNDQQYWRPSSSQPLPQPQYSYGPYRTRLSSTTNSANLSQSQGSLDCEDLFEEDQENYRQNGPFSSKSGMHHNFPNRFR